MIHGMVRLSLMAKRRTSEARTSGNTSQLYMGAGTARSPRLVDEAIITHKGTYEDPLL